MRRKTVTLAGRTYRVAYAPTAEMVSPGVRFDGSRLILADSFIGHEKDLLDILRFVFNVVKNGQALDLSPLRGKQPTGKDGAK